MSSNFQAIRTQVPNAPSFLLDSGPAINTWHNERGELPNQEPWTTQIFLKMLTDEPRFLDIGANIGWYTCLASVASDGKALVHAFEPEPTNLTLLEVNIRANDLRNVTVWPIALGATDGKTKLFISAENPGDHRLGEDAGRDAIDISIRTLDSVVESLGFVPDLVKIDVQGAEVMVFDGAKRTFDSASRTMAMLIEFQPEALGIEPSHELIERLYALNRPLYDIYPYDGGALRPIQKEVLHESVEGCLHPKHGSHIDILVAPYDYRLDRVRPLIGPAFVQWSYD